MKIFSLIAEKFKVSKKTIYNIINKYYDKGDIIREKGQGRKRKTTKKEDRLIIRNIKKHKKESQSQIVSKLSREYKINISEKTLMNRAKEKGHSSKKKNVIKMGLSKEHKSSRIKWCEERLNWSIMDWMKMIYSDESRFYLLKIKEIHIYG